MEMYIVDNVTYRLGVFLTDCTCEICEDLRLGGYPSYESCVYLGEMLIGSDCGTRSEKEALDSCEDMCLMFHQGELGYRPQDVFTAEAIELVKSMWR